MKGKIILGIVAFILLIITIIYFSNTFSTIDEQTLSCVSVQESCSGYNNCEMIEYNNEQIACIQGDEIDSEDAKEENDVIYNTYVTTGPEIESDVI